MKRVLILTYYWPPSGGSGVQRWLKFAKYLPEYGWEPIIYTAENAEYPVIDKTLEEEVSKELEVIKRPIIEPYGFYKKFVGQKKEEKIQTGFLSNQKPGLRVRISRFIRGNFFIPDARILWVNPSVNYLSKWLKENPVDAIVSTGPPHSTHLTAKKLAKKFNLPWVADFRDPWTTIFYFNELRLTDRSQEKHENMERSVLKNADRLLVVSKNMGVELNDIHPREYDVITNGFDTEAREWAGEVEIDKEFAIYHIGSFVPTMNHSAIWDAITELTLEDPDFKRDLRLTMIGKTDANVVQSIQDRGLGDHLKLINYIPHAEVINYQRKAPVLLLTVARAANSKGIMTGKIFEYINAKRPVLCVTPVDGDAAEVIRNTETGLIAGFDDKDLIKAHLKTLYAQFGSGDLKIEGKNIEAYSRKNLSGELAKLLNEIA